MPGEEKRQRLIETATQVMYQQGTHRTTLADVAQASGVPLGNIYYYFKTKDALVRGGHQSAFPGGPRYPVRS